MENLEPMNYYEAVKILDQVRDNVSYNIDTINKALELTGDLDIRELQGDANPASNKYGSQAWLDSLCQGKVRGA